MHVVVNSKKKNLSTRNPDFTISCHRTNLSLAVQIRFASQIRVFSAPQSHQNCHSSNTITDRTSLSRKTLKILEYTGYKKQHRFFKTFINYKRDTLGNFPRQNILENFVNFIPDPLKIWLKFAWSTKKDLKIYTVSKLRPRIQKRFKRR